MNANCSLLLLALGCVSLFQGNAQQVCPCGFTGENCQDRIQPKTFNFGLGYAFTILGIIAAIVYIYFRKNKDPKPALTLNELSETKCGPIPLLVYRPIIFITFLVVIAVTESELDTFTTWNGFLFVLAYLFGSVISFRKFFFKRDEDEPAGFFGQAYLIAYETELVGSVFITIMVWTVLFPIFLSQGTENQLFTPRQFFLHGINAICIWIEFSFNRMVLRWFHGGYIVIWGLTYNFMHLSLMLKFFINDEPHCPVYPFLDMSGNLFIIFNIGLVAVIFFFFWIGFRISQCKFNALYKDLQEENKQNIDVENVVDADKNQSV